MTLRQPILDVNDGIMSAAGITEGFVSAGASTTTLLLAGAAIILAGGSAVAGARYAEVRTEWEVKRALLEEERASIEADPAGELAELAGIYEAKGLEPQLARQVAEALTERDPLAAHADAELRLEARAYQRGHTRRRDRGSLLRCRRRPAARSHSVAAAGGPPGTDFRRHPHRPRPDGVARRVADEAARAHLVRRNVLLGGAIMAASILVGHVLH